MRFTPKVILTISLALIGPVLVMFEWGWFACIFLLVLAGLAKITIGLVGLVEGNKPIVLETISISHYAEKVRWCLDRLGVEYVEQHDMGILGALVAGRTVPVLHVPEAHTRIGNSPEILRYLYGSTIDPDKRRFLEQTRESLELEKQIDRFGIDIRVWAYEHILKDRRLGLQAWGVNEPQVPGWQRRLLPVVFPLLRIFLKRILKINPTSAEKCLKRSEGMFDVIDDLLSDGRMYIMGGDSLTYIDIAWAALSMPAVCPEEYGAGTIENTRISFEQVPEVMKPVILAFRERPAGKHALRLYREERML